MRILHTSDLHLTRSRRRQLLQAVADPWHDVWVDTGDLLPNTVMERGLGWAEAQKAHQVRFMRHTRLGPRLAEALAGRPAILLPGNHDFALLRLTLARAGARAFDGCGGFELAGERFAGFREVPKFMGRWMGEADATTLADRVASAVAANPTILLTHAPARGVHDDPTHALHLGIEGLSQALAHHPSIRWHLHGHIHETGGQVTRIQHHTHVNAACHFVRIDTARGEVTLATPAAAHLSTPPAVST